MYDMSNTPDVYPTWIPNTGTFAARLALVRQGMGWNLSEAAEAAGVPEANWREWELNGRIPRNIAEIAEKISGAAKGVDDYWLSTGKQKGIYPSTPGGGSLGAPGENRTHDLRFTLSTLPRLADAA